MKQKKQFSFMKQKSYLTAGVIALVAVIAMAGIYYKGKNEAEEAEKEAIVMADTEWNEENDVSGDADNRDTDTAVSENEGADEPDEPADQEADAAETGEEETPEETEDTEETSAQPVEPELHFSGSDRMAWPINGDVILNYSMDKSVYFATLDQYKYNPAVIISGEVNDRVVAAADGKVVSVAPDAETGITVTVDMGDGYQAVYGQLKQVEANAGDFISRGDIIGFINEPTKYYSAEGSNLYFALTKDGQPVNPLDFLE